MTKPLLNEAERFLLENWGEARLLEEAMEGVRTKYRGEVIQRIIDAVVEAHPELDRQHSFFTQRWSSGSIAFARGTWPGGESGWPAGLWTWALRLEILTAEDTDPPSGSIYVPKKCQVNLDLEAVRAAVHAAAKDLLTPEELKETTFEDSGEYLLWLPAPSKRELLESLADGDGQRFVRLFVSEYDLMARFIPVLDKVFRDCKKKG